MDFTPKLPPIRIAVTGAAGSVAYALIYMLSRGAVFGEKQPIILNLYDMPNKQKVLKAVTMELMDCILPLLEKVRVCPDLESTFTNANFVVLVSGVRRHQGIKRRDLLPKNIGMFIAQGRALNMYAHKNVKVLVVGNPANTNALVCAYYARAIPTRNFSCLTRLDQNRATAAIAEKLGVPPGSIDNVIIWGNHSDTVFPDVSFATMSHNNDFRCVQEAIDSEYLQNDFVKFVQNRGTEVMDAQTQPAALSGAKAICDHLRDWWFGTTPGQMVSMGVLSDGSYGVPKGIFFSFPVQIVDKNCKIVQNLPISEMTKNKLKITVTQLLEERTEAIELCKKYDAKIRKKP